MMNTFEERRASPLRKFSIQVLVNDNPKIIEIFTAFTVWQFRRSKDGRMPQMVRFFEF
jgi:hypothetical protein